MAESKGNPMFLASLDVGYQLAQDAESAFKTHATPAGKVRIAPAEWKAKVNSDPAFAKAEMARLEKELGGRRAAMSEFLRMWK